MKLALLWMFFLICVNVSFSDEIVFNTRYRERESTESKNFIVKQKTLRLFPSSTAILICDMWDDHHCFSAAKRVKEIAPFMNEVVKSARNKGVFIIPSPSNCMEFYNGTPQRKLAQEAPFVKSPAEFKWNYYNSAHEAPLPQELAEPGCSCDTPEPCRPNFKAWTRQIEDIEIESGDGISDNGQEIYNLLEQRGIYNVIIIGVHTNVCVLGRPFGIRQMVYNKKNILLCRDLTDTYHRDPGKHFQGIDRIVEHIEKYWCPTITSESITGKSPFLFKR